MHRVRSAAEVLRQEMKTAPKLQARAVKVSIRLNRQPLMHQMINTLTTILLKERQIKFFLAGMGITAGCVAVLAVAYAIGKKSAQKKAEKEKNHNDKTLENKTSDD